MRSHGAVCGDPDSMWSVDASPLLGSLGSRAGEQEGPDREERNSEGSPGDASEYATRERKFQSIC